jgi:TatD DNase family protein
VSDYFLADTHAHLNLEAFSSDLDEVIQRSLDQGVARILVPGIDLETSRQAIKLAEKYPFVYAAVGIHPNSQLLWNADIANQLSGMALHEKVVAIGEIGLDAYHSPDSIPEQKKLLAAQLEISAQAQKPVIIHSRETISEITTILMDWVDRLVEGRNRLSDSPGVVHAFEGDLHHAEQLVQHHFALGIGGQITYKNHTDLNEIVIKADFDYIITETDCPFLTPNPLRGKRNEPQYIRIIIDRIASIKQIEPAQAASVLFQNASRLFRWSE